MSDANPEFVGKKCVLEITAYLQREHGIDLEIGPSENMAIRICDAVAAASDRQLGALRRIGQLLAPDGPDRPSAVREALKIISDIGVGFEQ